MTPRESSPGPRRNVIIGTAGHIDHGKTVLVKALTGRDTDRLAEEKVRGISIDLGFAPLELPGGTVAGIVDVPGHENFVRNMMAGASGVDVALLVVAADDGVMPQTREHLAILDLLGVTRGVAAITKIDLVEPDFIELVAEDVVELLGGTGLENSPIIPVSGVTGEGIGELVEELALAVSEVGLKNEALPARMPIDRVFTLKGIGTVVTGTLWSGSIGNAESLELLPGGKLLRVRNLQVHDEERDRAYAGERVAVNAAAVSTEEIARGDVLCEPGYLRPTYMLDARIELLENWPRKLKRGARVRFHHGTREVMGRVYPLEGDEISPGDKKPTQLRLEDGAVCAPGDRFVLRSYSPVTTMGGGTVVDAHPDKHRPSDSTALPVFEALEERDPDRTTVIFLERAGRPLTAPELTLASGLPPALVAGSLSALAESGGAIALAGTAGGKERDAIPYIARAVLEDLAAAARDELERFHREKPLAEGMARETLRNRLVPRWDAKLADSLLEALERGGVFESAGDRVRIPGTGSSTTSEQADLIDRAVAAVEAGGSSPPSVADLAAVLGVEAPALRELLPVAEREGRVTRVTPDLYFSPVTLAKIERELRAALAGGKGITVSEFRSVIGASRKYALPLLEYFDRSRVTVRVGDVRRAR